ncbi:MAG: hypothetical protein ACJ790_04520 [Myxococcaceae bacterium]
MFRVLKSLALLLLVAATASAHGRRATSVSIRGEPGSSELAVGMTFGILVSENGAKDWYWVCDQAVGYNDLLDPKLLWAKNGALYAALSDKVVRSTDRGCSWSELPDFSGIGAADLAESAQGELFAVTQRFGVPNKLYRSTDGVKFNATSLERTNVFFTSVELAPSDPQRFYVSGWFNEPIAAFLYRSDDGAQTFTEVTPTMQSQIDFALLAVSPANKDVIFARALGQDSSVLLIKSTDAGASFRTVLLPASPLRDVLVSSDGHTVLASAIGGVFKSTDDGETFTKVASPSDNGCLWSNGSTTYVCGSPAPDGFSVGLIDVSSGAVTPLLAALSDIKGPKQCPAGTSVANTCSTYWGEYAPSLGITTTTPQPPSDPPPAKTCGCDAAAGVALPLGVLAIVRRRRRK